MSKWIQIILVLASGFALSIVIELKRRRSLLKYWTRTCTGSQWRRRFPSASKAEIRAFLDLFVEAFLFRRKRRLCFSPDDRIMDVYRASYTPDWSMADAMELEFLTKRMRKTYGIDIVPLWREDITLGELFRYTRKPDLEAGVS
jgi:hypothetical protein